MVSCFEHHVAHDVGEHDSHPLAAIMRVGISPVHDVSRGQDVQSDWRKPAKANNAVHAGDRGVLCTVDADGQDGGTGVLCNDRSPVIDLHQGTGYGNPSLWKDDRFLVFLDVVCERLDRQGLQRVHREHACNPKGRLDPPLSSNLRVDRKGDIVGQEGPEQDGIEIGGVVRDDQDPVARLLVVFQSGDLDPEEEHEEPTKEFFDHGVRSR